MAFTVSNLVQNILTELAQVEPNHVFAATGGTATTFVNSNFANFESPPEQDIFKNYLAIVVRDAGGASASPEGKWAVCSAYADATYTGTIATVTDAIASGDTIMLAKQDKFPLQQIIFAINQGLESLGDLPNNPNTSLTTVANETEYDIPVAVKRGLKQIWIQGKTNDSNDNQWIQVYDRRNDPAIGGTASVLYIPQYPAGRTIRLIYNGAHPYMSVYSDVISEYVHPTVATAASIIKLLEWYNRQDGNQSSESYTLWLETQYRQQYLPQALASNMIKKPMSTIKPFVKGRKSGADRPPSPFI